MPDQGVVEGWRVTQLSLSCISTKLIQLLKEKKKKKASTGAVVIKSDRRKCDK